MRSFEEFYFIVFPFANITFHLPVYQTLILTQNLHFWNSRMAAIAYKYDE